MPENNNWENIARRAVREGEYIVATGATVRACAHYFGTSKSGVHKDVAERLARIDGVLFKKVRAVLNKNLSERHIRGGMATRKKYLGRNSCRNRCADEHECDRACVGSCGGAEGCRKGMCDCAATKDE